MSRLPSATPPHKLFESPNSRTIEINNWSITATTNAISNASECDALQGQLGFALPEMTFGNNTLELHHKPSGWRCAFNARDALASVRGGEMQEGDGAVKVGYADAWLKSRKSPSYEFQTVPTKPYDWTYTTTYAGTFTQEGNNGGGVEWVAADTNQPSHTIPMAELTRRDPILFYAEVPLFEDELHDNGSSGLLIRIRVMPTCIFILSRFTLRVDNVLFRTFDTRMFHSFTSSHDPPLVVRECSGWEAPYNRVQGLLPRRDDLTPLTDPGFIAKTLTNLLPASWTQGEGAGTGWRGLGTSVQVSFLRPTA